MADVIYLAPLCQEHERMWCEHDAPVDCDCVDGPHPWIKYVAALLQPMQDDALREALWAMPEPYEYLNKDQLKSIRPYVDALRNWKHRYRAVLQEQSK